MGFYPEIPGLSSVIARGILTAHRKEKDFVPL